MAMKDCLASAAAQGAISKREAEELGAMFDDHLQAARRNVGDALAMAEAKANLEKELRNTSAEARRKANLNEAARLRLKAMLMQAKSFYDGALDLLSHHGGFANEGSVDGLAMAIITRAQIKMNDVMFAFQRSGVLGQRANKAMVPDLVDELHGKNSGDATAKYLAETIRDLFEDLRQRFNAAGGAMDKLDDFGIPHRYNRRAVKNMGPEKFARLMKAHINVEKMIDSRTGGVLSPDALDQALRHSYDQIVSNSAAHMTPTSVLPGLGAISNRRRERRFYVFKDGRAWLAVQKEIGEGDAVEAIFSHINTMAKDIAAMEKLGPNPDAMVQWLGQVVQREFGQKQAGYMSRAGEVSKLVGGMDAGEWAAHRIEWLWQSLRGRGAVAEGWVRINNGISDWTRSSILGATGTLAVLTDPVLAAATRYLAGMPHVKGMTNVLSSLKGATQKELAGHGNMIDEYLHVMGDELRYMGALHSGSGILRWVNDRAMTINGLKPFTTARKMTEARNIQRVIGSFVDAGKSLEQVTPEFRDIFKSFGVNDEDWKIWSAAVDPFGFVTPAAIEELGGAVNYLNLDSPALGELNKAAERKALRHRESAEKLAEMQAMWGERSVPGSRKRSTSMVEGGVKRGTILGELGFYAMQLKSFPISFTASQIEMIQFKLGYSKPGTVKYAAGLVTGLTVGAAMYIQLKHLFFGEDLEDMTDPAFWGKALLTGGGFGLFGDFLKGSENRFGGSLTESMLGPGAAFLADTAAVLNQWVMDGLNAGRDDAELKGDDASRVWLQRWTPIASSHPATKAAYNRIVLDNMQYLTNPDAHKSFKRKVAKAKKDGSPYFLPPGTFTPAKGKLPPRRAPNLENAFGR